MSLLRACQDTKVSLNAAPKTYSLEVTHVTAVGLGTFGAEAGLRPSQLSDCELLQSQVAIASAAEPEAPTKEPETEPKPDTAPPKPEEPPYEPSPDTPGRTSPSKDPGSLPVCENGEE